MEKEEKSIRLEQWSVVSRVSDPYQAPELGVTTLSGNVYGHPRFRDGTRIDTSQIRTSEGRFVKTASGSLYELGEPDPGFVKWCEKIGIPIDPQQPVKVGD